MQPVHLGCRVFQAAAVVDDGVGHLQPLCPAGLRGHDAAHLRLGQARTGHHACHLNLFGAVHHQHAVHPVQPVPGFNQQRHGNHHVGGAGGRIAIGKPGQFIAHGGLDQRMQDAFQLLASCRGGKDKRSHCGAVHPAVRGNHLVAEGRADGRNGGAPGRCQPMGDLVGIDQRSAAFDKQVRHLALSAADAAGQADGEQVRWGRRRREGERRRHGAGREEQGHSGAMFFIVHVLQY